MLRAALHVACRRVTVRLKEIAGNPKAAAVGVLIGLIVGLPIRKLRNKELEESGGGPWNGPFRTWWYRHPQED